MTNYLELPLLEINKKLKNKEIKVIDLVNECFYKIEKNKDLNCFITLNKEEAIKQALYLDNKEVDNILFGIPISIKDNIVTKDLKTTCASLMLKDFIPTYDATVITKIKEKNMVIIGKTNMDEFAMGSSNETSYFGSVLNPFDKTKVPGGSSGGSAVSVSSKIVPFSLGSDTGGSIRQPSAFNNLVGMKPTYGRISRYGLVSFASSLDQIGVISRNVYENALLLNVLVGNDENDLTSSNKEVIDFTRLINKDFENKKIAIPSFYVNEAIDKKILDKFYEIIGFLKSKGFIVEFVDIEYIENSVSLYQIIALAEASSNLARYDGIRYGYQTNKETKDLDDFYKTNRQEAFGDEVKRRIMIGSYVLSSENVDIYYYKALNIRKKITENFEKTLKEYDFIIGPTTTTFPYNLGEKQDDAIKSFFDDLLTIPINMAGLPSLNLPIGHFIGMQIISSKFNEDKIYQLAHFIESNRGGINE